MIGYVSIIFPSPVGVVLTDPKDLAIVCHAIGHYQAPNVELGTAFREVLQGVKGMMGTAAWDAWVKCVPETSRARLQTLYAV